MNLKLCLVLVIIMLVPINGDIEFLRQRSTKKMTPLSDKEFDTHVEAGPRDFDIILYITSEGKSFPCQYCTYVKEELQKVADWYAASVPVDKRDLFFVLLEFENNQKILQRYADKVKALPFIVRLPKTDKKGAQFKWQTKDFFDFTAMRAEPSAESFANQFNNMLGSKVLRQPPPDPTMFYLQIGAALIGVMLAIWFIIVNSNNPTLWFAGSLVIITSVYAGTVWNLQNNPPWSLQQMTFSVYPGREFQSLTEATIVSTGTVALGLMFVLMLEWAPSFTSRTKRFFAFIIVFAAFCGVLVSLSTIFFIKTPYYFSWSQ